MVHDSPNEMLRNMLPWRDAHALLREHGAGAGNRALLQITAFEEQLDYRAALWWGRVFVAIAHLTQTARPACATIH